MWLIQDWFSEFAKPPGLLTPLNGFIQVRNLLAMLRVISNELRDFIAKYCILFYDRHF